MAAAETTHTSQHVLLRRTDGSPTTPLIEQVRPTIVFPESPITERVRRMVLAQNVHTGWMAQSLEVFIGRFIREYREYKHAIREALDLMPEHMSAEWSRKLAAAGKGVIPEHEGTDHAISNICSEGGDLLYLLAMVKHKYDEDPTAPFIIPVKEFENPDGTIDFPEEVFDTPEGMFAAFTAAIEEMREFGIDVHTLNLATARKCERNDIKYAGMESIDANSPAFEVARLAARKAWGDKDIPYEWLEMERSAGWENGRSVGPLTQLLQDLAMLSDSAHTRTAATFVQLALLRASLHTLPQETRAILSKTSLGALAQIQ